MSHDRVIPDKDELAPYEKGLPLPEQPVNADGFPPGLGMWAIPHFGTFSAVQNAVQRAYRYTYDEALRHSKVNALAMRRDIVVFDALRAIQEPVAQLPWHIEVDDDSDSVQSEGVEKLTKIIESTPNLQRLLMTLMEAVWYGRHGAQVIYEWDWSGGEKTLRVRDHKPINGDKLVFRWSGEAAILVGTTWEGDYILTDRGRAHLLTPQEREQVIIHEHEPEDADWEEGELAGAIHGVGIRSRIYWFWWLKNQVLSWMLDFLERVGAGGLTIYYYEAGNKASLAEVKKAAEEQWRNNSILFPRFREGGQNGPGIERVEASQAGAQLLLELTTKYFDRVIRRYILGQEMSSEAVPGQGLSTGPADFQAETLGRRIKYHAVNLQETLTRDFLRVLSRYNTPKLRNPRFVFDVDKPNVKEILESAKVLYEMGAQLDEDHLRGIVGTPKPEPGASVLAQAPPMSPVAVNQPPMGVPQMGAPGPEQAQPQGPVIQ